MPTDLVEAQEYTAGVPAPVGGDPRTAASVRNMGTPLANRTRWTWFMVRKMLGGFATGLFTPLAITSVDDGADSMTLVGHGLVNNAPIGFWLMPGATLPLPLVERKVYFAKVLDADTFQVSLTAGGTAIDLAGTGSGAFYVASVSDPLSDLLAPADPNQPSYPFPAGTLREVLRAVYDLVGKLGDANTWTGAQIWIGDQTQIGARARSGSTAVDYERITELVSTTNPQPITTSFDTWVLPEPAADAVADLPAPADGASLLMATSTGGYAAFKVDIKDAGVTRATFSPTAGSCWVLFKAKSGAWKPRAWGGGTTGV